MEEKRIEAVRDWSEPQSVRDIQVFLGFANFYKRFMRNFSRIAAPLTSMLRITNESIGEKTQSTQTGNQDVSSAAGGADGDEVGGSIKNLSTVANLAKSKKSKSKANFAKANSGTDFLTFRAKKAFIHLRKAFTEAPILSHCDSERHIHIETKALGYVISGILSQMTLDQYFSVYMIHKDPNSSKSEISQ